MQLTINGKEYEFKFGVAFIAELDATHALTVDGAKFGAGLELTLPSIINMQNVTMLVEYLVAANKQEKARVGLKNIQDYIDGLTQDEYQELFDRVIEELTNATVTGLKVKALNKAAK